MNKDKIKEEFYKYCGDNGFNPLREECTDWWLSKLSESISQHNELLIKKIEEIIQIERIKLDSCRNDKVNWSYHQGKIHQMQDLLTLIKNSK